MDATQKTIVSIGFLTVRKHSQHGYFGGLLILNALARPLEFHCTLPVQPTRAQQILYGTTLEEFVCGEQIARALTNKVKMAPEVYFTDTLAALTVRYVQDTPIAAIDESWDHSSPSLPHPTCERKDLACLSAKGKRFVVLSNHESDLKKFTNFFATIESTIDLIEPFARIEEALMEAHPSTKAA